MSSGVMFRIVLGAAGSNGMRSCELPPIRSSPVPRLRRRFVNAGRAAGPM